MRADHEKTDTNHAAVKKAGVKAKKGLPRVF